MWHKIHPFFSCSLRIRVQPHHATRDSRPSVTSGKTVRKAASAEVVGVRVENQCAANNRTLAREADVAINERRLDGSLGVCGDVSQVSSMALALGVGGPAVRRVCRVKVAARGHATSAQVSQRVHMEAVDAVWRYASRAQLERHRATRFRLLKGHRSTDTAKEVCISGCVCPSEGVGARARARARRRRETHESAGPGTGPKTHTAFRSGAQEATEATQAPKTPAKEAALHKARCISEFAGESPRAVTAVGALPAGVSPCVATKLGRWYLYLSSPPTC